MKFMQAVAPTPYTEAVEHLPPGGTLVVPGVSWEDYEQLLEEIEAMGRHVRVTFDEGRLEIVAPLKKHEFAGSLAQDLIRAACRATGQKMEGLGSMTIRRSDLRRGVEPDRCFYIRNAHAVIGKDELDFTKDPPPDLAIEIDVTNSSRTKFPIYAALGVAELWRYDGERMQFYALERGSYEPAKTSGLFPFLDPSALNRFLDLGRSEGQDEALDAFTRWLRRQPE